MYSDNMYSNPFADFNANTMDADMILDFWQNPFETNSMYGISDDDIASDKSSIIFEGGRGTGKTMMLKNYSFSTQKKRAEKEGYDFYSLTIKNHFLGLYIRVDTPLLHSLNGLDNDSEQWSIIFTHFFELAVCKEYIEAILLFQNDCIIPSESFKKITQELSSLLSINEDLSLEGILNFVVEQINYVNKYKALSILSKTEFRPFQIYTFRSLIDGCADIIRANIPELVNVNFLILIDEYENFLNYQQRIINTAIKFTCSNNVVFRVGMRPEGFHVSDTVSPNEFIKEGRDYKRIVFDNHIIRQNNNKEYYNFLKDIARRRLNSVEIFRNSGLVNIETFLGTKEDPESEALKIVNGRRKHIDDYIKSIKDSYQKRNKEFSITKDEIEQLRYPENPLYEMQNMRLLLKPNPISWVIKAFNDFINKIDSPEGKKYKSDYSEKYKLSYVFVLCSIYKQKKLYYSFNDFCYLSSGIVGLFIELCRRSFQNAYFADKDDLFQGHISNSLQSRAALDVANAEWDQIRKISKYGNEVFYIAKYIGNKLGELHVDKRISYPETTQFTIDKTNIPHESDVDNILRAALRWSVMQKKKGLQQASIGDAQDEIYVLNRIFSPIFNISVRTRGGYNEKFDKDSILHMIDPDNYDNPKDKPSYFPKKQYSDQLSFDDFIRGDDGSNE